MDKVIQDYIDGGCPVTDWSVTNGCARVTVQIGKRIFYLRTMCDFTLSNWLFRKAESAKARAALKGK